VRVYLELPQPEALSEREKGDAMGTYFMMFAAFASSLLLAHHQFDSCGCLLLYKSEKK
jgi:hypothetical protein